METGDWRGKRGRGELGRFEVKYVEICGMAVNVEIPMFTGPITSIPLHLQHRQFWSESTDNSIFRASSFWHKNLYIMLYYILFFMVKNVSFWYYMGGS